MCDTRRYKRVVSSEFYSLFDQILKKLLLIFKSIFLEKSFNSVNLCLTNQFFKITFFRIKIAIYIYQIFQKNINVRKTYYIFISKKKRTEILLLL